MMSNNVEVTTANGKLCVVIQEGKQSRWFEIDVPTSIELVEKLVENLGGNINWINRN